jgi:probable rRNA maturation factor
MTGQLDLYIQADVPSPISEDIWQRWFASWLQAMGIAGACELSLCLTDDRHIQALNRQYRHSDRPTDVLAFAAREADLPTWQAAPTNKDFLPPTLLGDIVISVPTAQVQASERGHSLETELGWLATHGFLHLLGWDHPDDLSLHQMLLQQEQLLNRIEMLPTGVTS